MAEMGFNGTITIAGSAESRVKDLTMNLERDDADATTRADEGWENIEPGMARWGAEFDIVNTAGDTAYTALRAACISGAALTVSIADDTAETVTGSMSVMRFTRNEPLNGVVTTSCRLAGKGKPSGGI